MPAQGSPVTLTLNPAQLLSALLSRDFFVIFPAILVCLASLALLAPVVVYLWSGWRLRRHEIVSSFTDEALDWYYQTFFQTDYAESLVQVDGKPALDIGRLKSIFECNYVDCFGRMKYMIPGILLLAVAVPFLTYCALVVPPHLIPVLLNPQDRANPDPTLSIPLVVVAGFAGGYMWVLQFTITRMQERRLSPNDLYWGTFRLLVAVPIALAFTALLGKEIGGPTRIYAVSFMLGAFPTRFLMTMMRRAAASVLKWRTKSEEPYSELMRLQGIERDQAETFDQEGVKTILQLAYADPVDLTIRTGFSFSYVVDCCSQALAWLYFGNSMSKLRPFSLRGAQEVVTFVYELSQNTKQSQEVMDDEKAMAKETLKAVAYELHMNEDVLRRTCDEIAYDPYAQFLYHAWQSKWN